MLRRRNKRVLATAFALSLLVHLAMFLRLPPFQLNTSELTRSGETPGELSVQLMPAPRPAPARPPVMRVPPPSIAQRPPPPQPTPRPPRAAPRPRPPVLALKEPSPSAPPVPRAPPTPPATDLASFVEARRRARGETAPPESAPSTPSESANAKANRLAAANLGAGRPATFGYDPSRSGGVFSVTKQTYDYAEFMFYGWQGEVRRNISQVVPVQKGNAPDIRIAIVHKMIAIIRDYEQGDFVWESVRLGRNVTLSARQRDTAGLESFLLREFFPEWRRP